MSFFTRQAKNQLKAELREAVVSCNDRCLYNSAKWYVLSTHLPTIRQPALCRGGRILKQASRAAELLNSLSSGDESDDDIDDEPGAAPPAAKDALEARLEAREADKYLVAKTYFDCRELDRCAAVFLPRPLPTVSTTSTPAPAAKHKPKSAAKGKSKAPTPSTPKVPANPVQRLSQKALFLALYAKYLVGEKRMNEDSEMILGPQDGGATLNKELPAISAMLEEWFNYLPTSGRQPQGWLEYLYGIVLAKGKNEKLALHYFLESVRLYPYNWGAYQELSHLLESIEAVSDSRRTGGFAS